MVRVEGLQWVAFTAAVESFPHSPSGLNAARRCDTAQRHSCPPEFAFEPTRNARRCAQLEEIPRAGPYLISHEVQVTRKTDYAIVREDANFT